jgi:formate dehydrogenase subunit delta
MPPDKLIRMANQIAAFMASRPAGEAAAGVAQHISDYWAPPMRRQLFEIAAAGGGGLHPLVRAAVPLIRPPPEAA